MGGIRAFPHYVRVMVISENVVVGHLGYGGVQTKEMLEYYKCHREQFALKG